MSYQLKYSPAARDKLREIKAQITEMHGIETASKILYKITSDIRGLQDNHSCCDFREQIYSIWLKMAT